MVLPILEPVCAGIMVSLINKFILNGSCGVWILSSCTGEQVRADMNEVVEETGDEVSSTNTSITDAEVHVHCH
jgi:hypothetical protein